ncbi:MAG: protease complex subunit PrcB family protein [Lachnospiraceae bacterium]|nr:protease complex subunit PrcB family protein [Lachnospiraceae bacterium]
MKKCRILLFLFIMMLSGVLAGCGAAGQGTAGDRKEVDYTVADARKLPEELARLIEENKKEEIRMTYTDGADMYLIRGYGEQETGGYSIEVAECSEDGETVYFDTRLLGPSGQEKLPKEPSYPFLVVKIETREKDVLIQ